MSMPQLGRRRFLSIMAAAATVPLPVAFAATGGTTRWSGVALGARASITVAAPGSERLIRAALAEIERLEAIFSLYRSESAISRLNHTGRLSNPPPDFLRILSLSRNVHKATSGAFDPTVQPLWVSYAEHFAGSGGRATGPSSVEIERVRKLVGWEGVEFGTREIRFARPGMALTLNGIAQGYIADRVSDLLRNEGLERVLVQTGEIRAVGTRPDGAPWRVGLDPEQNTALSEDRSVAVSEPLGTHFDGDGRLGHILDPRTGRPGGLWRSVTVFAEAAGLADALSTGLCLLKKDEIDCVRLEHPNLAVIAEV